MYKDNTVYYETNSQIEHFLLFLKFGHQFSLSQIFILENFL